MHNITKTNSSVVMLSLVALMIPTSSYAQNLMMNKNYLLNDLLPAPQDSTTPASAQPIISTLQTEVEKEASTKKKLFFAGSDVNTKGSYSALTGVIAPLPIANSTIGNGWVARMMGFGGQYEYKSGTQTIQSRGGSGGLSIGYVQSGEKGWWGAYAGPSISYSKLTPDDLSNGSRGRNWALDTQIGGERSLTKDFKLNGSVSYQFFNNNNFWSRLRPLTRLTNNIFIGPEFIYQGDNSYRAGQLGAVVTGFDIGHGMQIGFKAGAQKTKGDSTGAYIGFEIGGEF
jgi:hypothetical protein